MAKEKTGVNKPIQCRFKPEELAEIDAIKAHLESLTGLDSTRTDALRWSVKHAIKLIRKPKK